MDQRPAVAPWSDGSQGPRSTDRYSYSSASKAKRRRLAQAREQDSDAEDTGTGSLNAQKQTHEGRQQSSSTATALPLLSSPTPASSHRRRPRAEASQAKTDGSAAALAFASAGSQHGRSQTSPHIASPGEPPPGKRSTATSPSKSLSPLKSMIKGSPHRSPRRPTRIPRDLTSLFSPSSSGDSPESSLTERLLARPQPS